MADSNLWPNIAQIMSWGQDTPYQILQEQAEQIKNVDHRLRVIIDDAQEANVPLSNIQFDTSSVIPTPATTVGVVFRFSIGRIDKVYSFEVLRLRNKAPNPYPVELYDSLNFISRTLYNRFEFENYLQRAFNSPKCLEKLRYLLFGPIV